MLNMAMQMRVCIQHNSRESHQALLEIFSCNTGMAVLDVLTATHYRTATVGRKVSVGARICCSFGLPDSPCVPSVSTLNPRQHMLACFAGATNQLWNQRAEMASGLAQS